MTRLDLTLVESLSERLDAVTPHLHDSLRTTRRAPIGLFGTLFLTIAKFILSHIALSPASTPRAHLIPTNTKRSAPLAPFGATPPVRIRGAMTAWPSPATRKIFLVYPRDRNTPASLPGRVTASVFSAGSNFTGRSASLALVGNVGGASYLMVRLILIFIWNSMVRLGSRRSTC